MEATEVVHFYSYQTGISFELPVGFEQDHEEPNLATYTLRSDADDSTEPRVLVRRVPGPEETGTAAAQQLLDGMTAGLTDVSEPSTRVVDQETVTTVVGTGTDPDGGDEAVVHASVVAVDGSIVTVTGVLPHEQADDLVPALDEAIRSIRFVTL